ncbi:MAG: class I SAM-dependent methyltransferase [bacterium]
MNIHTTTHDAPRCRACGNPTSEHGRAVILSRHNATYWRCTSCGYIQTDVPWWLDEAYGEAIAASDVGLVSRNLEYAEITRSLIHACFNTDSQFVDYGGGYGLLVRLLRDAGLDFRRYDPLCRNILAQGLDAAPGEEPSCNLVTAFEVFEHLVDPVDGLSRMLQFSRNVFLSTLLVTDPAPAPGAWWYYCLETGQHVGLFTLKSLHALAQRFELNFVSDGVRLHLFTERSIPSWKFRIATRYRVARALKPLQRLNPLTESDYRNARRQGAPV